jgi:hypothetical protein
MKDFRELTVSQKASEVTLAIYPGQRPKPIATQYHAEAES